LNSGSSPWATPPALFLWRVFWGRISQNYLPGLALNRNPPDFSASWIASITGVSHQHPARLWFELGALCLQAGALPLEPHLQCILLWLFWRWGSLKLFAWAGGKPWSLWFQPPK
jgi:hypothetical protein